MNCPTFRRPRWLVLEKVAEYGRPWRRESLIMDLKLTALFVTLSAIIGLSGYPAERWQTLQAKFGRWRIRRR